MKLCKSLLLSILLFVLSLLIPSGVRAGTGVPILMYHYIRDYNNPNDSYGNVLSVSLKNFDEQLNYLTQNGYTTISLDELSALNNGQSSVPGKPVVLTFDDGTIDFYTNAYPILKKYNMHAVSFVITGFVGNPQYVSWDNINEMKNSGLVTFESHTVSHAFLPKTYDVLSELKNSKAMLESHTGYPVNFISYPFGNSNSYIWGVASQAGYIGGLGTSFGKSYGTTMNMPRVRINGGDSLDTFIYKIQ
ncbi:MAG: polysaccharide deacetylase family protein [Patescibacteria group bacterium]|nr:polysaccharide deacetylase family protein [Patescibacteria group bacterium]